MGHASMGYSIIIPVFNSSLMLQELYQRLITVMESLGEIFEVIFVEDCGSDNAWQLLQTIAQNDTRIIAIQMFRNTGQGTAILAGIAHSKGAFIITLDDDLQHPPEEIPVLINALRNNDSLDVVMGVSEVKCHNLFRRGCTILINHLNIIFIKKPPHVQLTAFRIMRKQIAMALLKKNVPYPSIGPMLLSVTNRLDNIRTEHHPRKKGKTGYTLFKLFRQGLSNIVGYSVMPLHILAVVGIGGIFFCTLFTIYLLSRYFIVGVHVPGWMTILLMMIMFFSFNFLAFSLLGEYILRIMIISTTPSQWGVRHIINREIVNTRG